MQRLTTPEQAAQWLQARVGGQLRTDSRQVQPGDGFIAWPGAATDGRQHVRAALAAGASACLVEASGADAFGLDGLANVAALDGLKQAAGWVASHYFEHPSAQLQVLAVTGTNGKTSTTWWLAQALARLGQPCGVIGTLGVGQPGAMTATGLTTPDPVTLQRSLRGFVAAGMRFCAIEASSIGIEEHRLDGTAIGTAVLTNFTQDHLDYHGSMQAYWQAKQKLFAWPGLRAAVINGDDAVASGLIESLKNSAAAVKTYGVCYQNSSFSARSIHYHGDGLAFDVTEGAQRIALQTRLIGDYNVANLLAVIATLRTQGIALADAVAACRELTPVAGRMDCVSQPGQPLAVIDYAHTPDALDKALAALRPMAQARGGQLWCVFGCGGDRDPAKRPLMGRIAEAGADRPVITSDNPRSEPPQAIIAQILAGYRHPSAAQVQPERAQAITQALHDAAAGDVVLIAGKGHEDYQEIGGVKRPFSDQAVAQAALRQRMEAPA